MKLIPNWKRVALKSYTAWSILAIYRNLPGLPDDEWHADVVLDEDAITLAVEQGIHVRNRTMARYVARGFFPGEDPQPHGVTP